MEAVRFGQQEETIVSGTRSGALKVWNLEAAKMMRVLTGHKVRILYGDTRRIKSYHPHRLNYLQLHIRDVRICA